MIFNIFANQMSKVRITEHSIGEGAEKGIYSTFQHLEVLSFVFFFFLAVPHGLQNLSSPNKDWTRARVVECLTTRPPGNSPFSNTTGGKAN